MSETVMMQDLWPPDVEVKDVVSPVAIMRYQANQLRVRTRGLLEGDVRSITSEEQAVVCHEFDIVAPSLGGYRYNLFSATHRMDLVYPVSVVFQAAAPSIPGTSVAIEGVGPTMVQAVSRLTGLTSSGKKAATQTEFVDVIREILSSPHAKSVIHSLIARINDTQSKAS
jgi:hypothetical protein